MAQNLTQPASAGRSAGVLNRSEVLLEAVHLLKWVANAQEGQLPRKVLTSGQYTHLLTLFAVRMVETLKQATRISFLR